MLTPTTSVQSPPRSITGPPRLLAPRQTQPLTDGRTGTKSDDRPTAGRHVRIPARAITQRARSARPSRLHATVAWSRGKGQSDPPRRSTLARASVAKESCAIAGAYDPLVASVSPIGDCLLRLGESGILVRIRTHRYSPLRPRNGRGLRGSVISCQRTNGGLHFCSGSAIREERLPYVSPTRA